MKTTTRKYLRTNDVYYDGIEWGTPIGSIMFKWVENDSKIQIYHNNELIHTTEGSTINYVAKARIIVNRMIGAFLK